MAWDQESSEAVKVKVEGDKNAVADMEEWKWEWEGDAEEDIKEVPEIYCWPRSPPPPPFRGLNNNDDDDEEKDVLEGGVIAMLDMELEEEKLVKKLREVCLSMGAFQIVNHAVPQQVVKRMDEHTLRLFALPLHRKMQAASQPAPYNTNNNNSNSNSKGFMGYGPAQISDLHSKRMWAEGFTFIQSQSNLDMALQLWPDHPHAAATFCDAIEEYNVHMRKLANRLMRLLVHSLGEKNQDQYQKQQQQQQEEQEQEQEEEEEKCDGFAALRMNHYPPSPWPEHTMAMAAHTDSTFLTILHQGTLAPPALSPPPLHIKHSSCWLPVRHVPGAFTVHLGDLFQVLSNGEYKSAEHRVVSSVHRRISTAYLWGPATSKVVQPLPHLVDPPLHPRRYKPLTWQQYLAARAHRGHGNAAALADFTLS